MRVAIVTGSVSRLAGGLYHSVRNTAIELANNGVGVEVFGLEDIHTEADVGAWLPIKPKVHRAICMNSVGYSSSLYADLIRGDFDLVHQHGIWQGFSHSVSAWRKRTNGKVVISPRGMLDSWALENSKWKKKIAKILFEQNNIQGAHCMHALNVSEMQSIRNFGYLGPISMMPNGTHEITQSNVFSRPGWLPNDGRKNLLFLGRIHPKKGIQELLEAWGSLKLKQEQLVSDWRLIIAGWDDGGHLAEVSAHVEAQMLGNDVIFPGPLFGAEKDAALQHADAFVLPSHSEGLPMAVLEAWRQSLPVLMTDACNLPDGFERNAAYRIEIGTSKTVSDLASFLSLSDTEREEMGYQGERLLSEKFLWSKIGEQHIETYVWLLDESKKLQSPDFVHKG